MERKVPPSSVAPATELIDDLSRVVLRLARGESLNSPDVVVAVERIATHVACGCGSGSPYESKK